jgi:beta-N-acetylglucosaminidase
MSAAQFEAYLTRQGFPEDYKKSLRGLHTLHPNWVFVAYKTGLKWNDVLKKETAKNVSLVHKSYPSSYRSSTYRSQVEPGWYNANSTIVAYYMDPRNFLDENGIYQFMTHKYDSSSQNATTVRAVVKGSFMETRATGDSTYPKYPELINAAGKAAGVNPNVIAAMIYQEQGSKGSSGLISGTYSGYKGYYNFFNIGAYTTSSMTAVQRGLWYAKQSGSYGRPWNSVYKSIKGGASFYVTNYVNAKQDTYYYKKFNVKNGASKIGTHQYMTYVAAAAKEGNLLKKAFQGNSTHAAVIEIPIYTSMPSAACKLP